jgi:hypothetical protein
MAPWVFPWATRSERCLLPCRTPGAVPGPPERRGIDSVNQVGAEEPGLERVGSRFTEAGHHSAAYRLMPGRRRE